MPMNKETLMAAMTEARRFLDKAKKAHHSMCQEKGPLNFYGTGYGPDNAAARRASMDLTRALAELRKA